MDDYCWPLDDSCCAEFSTYPQDVQDRAAALAGMTLRMLTANRVGGCPVTVRPCRQVCAGYQPFYGGSAFAPVNWSGTWFNCTCGGDTCGCGALCQLELPRPIGAVQEVKIDGVIVDPWTYRVDDGRWLIRLNGECWPDCQDLSLADTEVGTFSVTYLNAIPVDSLGQYAGGVLACEFAKACSGGKCRLPSGVTSVARQGVSYEIAAGSFPNGATGIREVDAWIAQYNPNHLRVQPQVWSPDEPVLVRTITVPPGPPPIPDPPTYQVTAYSDKPFVGGLAGLQVQQTSPDSHHATDAEIASINWGDATIQTAPYTRPGPGLTLITHQYQSDGIKVWTVTFTDPQVQPATGTFTVRYSYYVDASPPGGVVEVGEPFGIAPWDAYAAEMLPTNEHFDSIEWGDGTIDHNPFVLDASGYATHIYETAGSPRADITFLDGYRMGYTVTVEPGAIDIDYRLEWEPANQLVFVGGTFGMRPLNGPAGPPIPPDTGFTSLDWGDGTPVEYPPFTVDANGFATHVYTAVGNFDTDAFFADGTESGTLALVTDPPPTYAVIEMNEYPVVDFEDTAGLLIRQVLPTPGLATDAEIASILWEPGVVQPPPFVRDVLGRVTHTYTSFGPKNWRVDFTDPDSAPVTGIVNATYYYYIGWLPSNAIIVAGGTMAMRPLDNWQGNPLPPDQHFAAVDWADGSPIQHPPFTVDGSGYATHVYTVAGTYNIQIGFIDTSITSLGITVTATQEDADALRDQPPPVESKPPPDET